jgi:ferric-dicitrate binding protein FerR (iron transport regulator)
MHQKGDRHIDYYEELADRLLKGTITPEQKAELDLWYMHHTVENVKVPRNYAQSEADHEQLLFEQISKRLGIEEHHNHIATRRKFILWSSAAAAVLLIFIAAGWWMKSASINPGIQDANIAMVADIAPGHEGAVLQLSNGKKVILDSLRDGMVVQQGGIKVVKENGQLKYIGVSDELVYNDIVTDRGRQWKMVLPDGTQVWLNAASSLHFPVSFKGQKERIVQLTGEAYFKVAHNSAQPFKVIAGNKVIEDIGTEFNVNAYGDESSVVTTLVEGIVKVDHVQLKPGQQASIDRNGKLQIREVNPQDYIAWVTGQLSLDNVSVKELMRQLSRWYDVDVVYQGKVPDIRLGGLIDRKVFLSDIITVLNVYGVHLKLVGKSLIVSP